MTEVSQVADEGLRDLLASGSWNGVLESIGAPVPEDVPKATIKARKKALAKALASLDETSLLAMQEEMSNFIDEVHRANLKLFTPDGQVVALSDEEKVALMNQVLTARRIGEVVEVIDDVTKQWVRATIAEQNAEENPGDPWPDQRNGEILVEGAGKRFVLQGMGPKTPLIDEAALADQLGEELWDQVTETIIVPASEQVVFSEEKLRELMRTNPAIIPQVERALIHAGFKPGSVWYKDIE